MYLRILWISSDSEGTVARILSLIWMQALRLCRLWFTHIPNETAINGSCTMPLTKCLLREFSHLQRIHHLSIHTINVGLLVLWIWPYRFYESDLILLVEINAYPVGGETWKYSKAQAAVLNSQFQIMYECPYSIGSFIPSSVEELLTFMYSIVGWQVTKDSNYCLRSDHLSSQLRSFSFPLSGWYDTNTF